MRLNTLINEKTTLGYRVHIKSCNMSYLSRKKCIKVFFLSYFTFYRDKTFSVFKTLAQIIIIFPRRLKNLGMGSN